MIKIIKERWQVQFNPSLIGVIPLVRKNGRGDWQSCRAAPAHIREFLDIEPDSMRMDRARWPNVAAVKAGAHEIKWCKVGTRGWVTIERRVEVAPPIPKGSGRRIKNLEDLCRYFCADSPGLLNKRIYKGTDCGASISLYLANGEVYHRGDRRWDTLAMDAPVKGFTIQTIVEGSEATVDSDLFWVPCPIKWVREWISAMEDEASVLWEEASRPDDDPRDVDDRGAAHARKVRGF
jgi:hypothetical protein